jgi:uncharacterized protein YjbI with pentapeptide repeats
MGKGRLTQPGLDIALIPYRSFELMSVSPTTTGAIRRLTQKEADAICERHDRLWAAKPGGARAVFSWLDLTGLEFRGRNLSDADFTGAILDGAKFVKCKLDHAIFFGADMQNADFSEASMRRADLRGACLRNADLTGADLFEADLREGVIAQPDRLKGLRVLEPSKRAGEAQGAVLIGANLERSKMSGVVAIKADFTDAVLKDANLVRAHHQQGSMIGANLAGADLSGADLSGADLRDSILVGAKTYAAKLTDMKTEGALTDAPAIGANSALYEAKLKAHALWCETGGSEGTPSTFDAADLRGLAALARFNHTPLSAKRAVFYGLDMEGAQLQGAHLEGADLRACNLRGADLRGARLTGAKLSGADLREAQLGPLLIANDRILPADLTRAVLKSADLSGADLRQAIFVLADISRSRFNGANTRNTDFTGAYREGVRGLDLN